MAGKSKKKKAAKRPKAKSQKPKTRLVWHIFHFGERFELPRGMQACRNGPLQFVKLPVLGDPYDNESHILLEQLGMLECQDNTLVLEGVIWRLVRQAGWRSRKYRGYLLNERYLPMTPTHISRVLGLKLSESAGVLHTLAKYNLIERIPMPDFAAVTDEPEEKEQPQKGTKGAKDQKPKGKGQKPNKTDVDGGGVGANEGAAPPSSLDIDKLCDRSGMAFGEEVFGMLFERRANLHSLNDRRELAAFAGCWNRAVLASLKPSQLNKLWEKSINVIPTDKRRVMKAKNPCAAWTSIFNGRLTGMKNAK